MPKIYRTVTMSEKLKMGELTEILDATSRDGWDVVSVFPTEPPNMGKRIIILLAKDPSEMSQNEMSQYG